MEQKISGGRKYKTCLFERRTLSNGIPVHLQKQELQPDETGILIVVFNNIGAIFDPQGKEGVAHFLEHLPFRGTQKFPDIAQLTGALDERNMVLNAQTGYFTTAYHCSGWKGYFPLALERVHQISLHPYFTQESFDKERGPIRAEISKSTSDSQTKWNTAYYGEHHRLCSGVAGTHESLENITLDDICEFYEKYYKGSNIEIICGGSFSQESNVVDLLDSTFGDIPFGSRIDRKILDFPIGKSGHVEIVTPRRNNDCFSACWLFPFDRFGGYASQILCDTMVKSVSSGRLLKLIRVEKPIAYSVVFQNGIFGNGRFFSLETVVDRTHFQDVRDAITKALSQIDRNDVERCFQNYAIHLATSFIHPVKACTNALGQIRENGVITDEFDHLEEIGKTTVEDVLALRDALLDQPPFTAHFIMG